jgi:hypothetical protein
MWYGYMTVMDHRSPGGTISVEYTARVDEVAKVLQFQLRLLLRQKVILVIAAVCVAGGVAILAVRTDRPAPGIVLLAVGAFYLLWVTVFLDALGRRAAAKSVSNEKSRWMEFSDEGVRLGTALRDNLTRWEAFSEVIEWDGFYLLHIGRTRLHGFVPRRAFASEEDERDFRELVGHHVPLRTRATKGTG